MNIYKVRVDDRWIYNDITKIVNSNSTNTYYVEENKVKYEVKEENICRPTDLKAGNQTIFTKDIILVPSDEGDLMFIVDHYKGYMNIDDIDIYIDGLCLLDFNFKPFFMAKKLIESPELITIIGNTITNNIKDYMEVENNVN